MSASIPINLLIKKFIIFYFLTLLISIFSLIFIFSLYTDYVFSIIKGVSHNSIMIHDGFSLKQGLSPLVVGNVLELAITDSQKNRIFFHDQNEIVKSLYVNKNYEVYQQNKLLYNILIKFDLSPLFLVIFLIAVLASFLYYPFSRYERKEYESRLSKELANLAYKVAHDIRSPISTLNLISSKIESDQIREIHKLVIERINGIADDLLITAKLKAVKMNDNYTESTIGNLVNLLKAENDLADKSQQIIIDFDEALFNVKFKHINTLYPIIRNLVNNAVEATLTSNRKIEVNFSSKDKNYFLISVKDNGKGMSEELLNKLGCAPVSSGKSFSASSGAGIAIHNAVQDLDKIGASLKIDSSLNEGSCFTITFALSN